MLSPTKLLGDMSPVRPRRFRHINAYLQQTTTYLLANLLVRSADSSYSLFLSRSESASSVGGWWSCELICNISRLARQPCTVPRRDGKSPGLHYLRTVNTPRREAPSREMSGATRNTAVPVNRGICIVRMLFVHRVNYHNTSIEILCLSVVKPSKPSPVTFWL